MTGAKQVVIKALILVAAVAAVGSFSGVRAGPPRCPEIWAPVICDGGKIYPNQCVADSRHAKNCVPYPEGL